MKSNEKRSTICPLCGKTYSGYPVTSRTDNEMLICQDCGIRQALESIGVEAEEREEILGIIHRRTRR